MLWPGQRRQGLALRCHVSSMYCVLCTGKVIRPGGRVGMARYLGDVATSPRRPPHTIRQRRTFKHYSCFLPPRGTCCRSHGWNVKVDKPERVVPGFLCCPFPPSLPPFVATTQQSRCSVLERE
ncbi:hypothetical protein J6590_008088 [Homalodisca vitripennis]|nr:hypothetical protein J6590_008088 [Homalodisca vitripennis]